MHKFLASAAVLGLLLSGGSAMARAGFSDPEVHGSAPFQSTRSAKPSNTNRPVMTVRGSRAQELEAGVGLQGTSPFGSRNFSAPFGRDLIP